MTAPALASILFVGLYALGVLMVLGMVYFTLSLCFAAKCGSRILGGRLHGWHGDSRLVSVNVTLEHGYVADRSRLCATKTQRPVLTPADGLSVKADDAGSEPGHFPALCGLVVCFFWRAFRKGNPFNHL
jgi:hypothetical protein